MNILHTGGLGYIGSHTAVADRIGRIIGLRPAVEVGDALDTARLRQILGHYAIGAVIHFTVNPSACRWTKPTPPAPPNPTAAPVRDYLHVMDLAEGHRAALDHLARTDQPCDTFNLGTGQGTSVLQMVRAFEQASGRPVPYRIAPRRPGDVAECWADPTKARQVLGWQAVHTLHDMCASTWGFVSRS